MLFTYATQKKKKKAVAIDLDEVDVPSSGSKSDSPNNVAKAAGGATAGVPKLDKMGNTIEAEAADEAYVASA